MADLNEVDRELYARHFREFVPDAFEVVEGGDTWAELVRAGRREPKYVAGWHIDAIADHLQAVADGQISRLLINVPPGCMKSMMVSVMWPAWMWIRDPSKRLLFSSYSEEFTKRDLRLCRDLICSDWFQALWPNVKVKAQPDTMKEFHLEGGGLRQGSSTNSGVTGKHFHCFPADTQVRTELGELSIAALAELADRPRVLAFDHTTESLVWANVKAAKKLRSRDLYEIRTTSGRRVRATGEHRFYVEGQGYKEASRLACGDSFFCERPLRDLQLRGVAREPSLSELLQSATQNYFEASLRDLFDCFREAFVRIREGLSPTRIAEILLFQRMCAATPSDSPSETLRFLQDPYAREIDPPFLQQSLLGEGAKEAGAHSYLQAMREKFQGEGFCTEVLREAVRQRAPFAEHARRGEFELQNWARISQGLQDSAKTHPGAGRAFLRGLCELFQAVGAPYRRESTQQSYGEFDNALQRLSHHSPQVEKDAVAVVRPVGDREIDVYDIEVEGFHNFFANEILVHNCIVEDDPLKAQDAHSQRARNEAWDYRTQTLGFRLLPEAGARVVVMQRLHQDDVSGRIIARNAESSEKYVHLCLPMEYEKSRACSTSIGFVDPRKEEGELLWPARMDRAYVEEKKSPQGLGAYGYAGQAQQRPAPAVGGIIKREWLRFYRLRDLPKDLTGWEQNWDLIFTGDGEGSFAVGQVWARCGANHYFLYQMRERVEFVEQVRMVLRMTQAYPKAIRKKVENKADGAALISTLQGKIPGIIAWPPKGQKLVSGINAGTSKPERLMAVSPLFEAGNVWVPHPEEQPWVEDWIEEIVGMTPEGPSTPNDDQHDCTVQYLSDKGLVRKNLPFTLNLEVGARVSPNKFV